MIDDNDSEEEEGSQMTVTQEKLLALEELQKTRAAQIQKAIETAYNVFFIIFQIFIYYLFT